MKALRGLSAFLITPSNEAVVVALRTDETLKLAQDAKGAGAAVGLLAPMSYTPLTDDEVFAHFVTVAEQSGLPL